jgi:hypothetical protein
MSDGVFFRPGFSPDAGKPGYRKTCRSCPDSQKIKTGFGLGGKCLPITIQKMKCDRKFIIMRYLENNGTPERELARSLGCRKSVPHKQVLALFDYQRNERRRIIVRENSALT